MTRSGKSCREMAGPLFSGCWRSPVAGMIPALQSHKHGVWMGPDSHLQTMIRDGKKALKLGGYDLTGVRRGFESRWARYLFAGVRATSTLARGDCHVRVERLMVRSGTPGVGEDDRAPPKMSTSCSCRTTEYLGSRRNFGTESFNQRQCQTQSSN